MPDDFSDKDYVEFCNRVLGLPVWAQRQLCHDLAGHLNFTGRGPQAEPRSRLHKDGGKCFKPVAMCRRAHLYRPDDE